MMTKYIYAMRRFASSAATLTGFAMAALALSPVAAPSAFAQIESVDPNDLIDADLDSPATVARDEAQAARNAVQNAKDTAQDNAGAAIAKADFEPGFESGVDVPFGNGADGAQQAQSAGSDAASANTAPNIGGGADNVPATTANADGAFQQDDLIGAAEGVFGKGAKGLASLIEDILKKQGRPNGYIVGREAGGAFVVGLRYGSGTLYHAVEGERPVYWTGPSIGVDAGANAANSFTLVYNLYDTEDLYKRFGAGEGQAYLVGGFNASYLRRGNVVLIPIRVGVGARLGANIGYRKFSKKQRWFPF